MNTYTSKQSMLFAAALCGVIALITLGGCSTNNDFVYKLYPGPELPDSELATLRFGGQVFEARIDGLNVMRRDYGAIKVAPGRHTISYGAEFGVSVMVNPAMHDAIAADTTIELEPGRSYILQGGRTYGQGYTMYLWIEDAETGDVVGGVRKP